MWADPLAVDVVVKSGLALEFVGWDISRIHAVVDPDPAPPNSGPSAHPLAEFCVDIQSHRRRVLRDRDQARRLRPARSDHDGLRHRPHHRHRSSRASTSPVETESELTRGMVVMDVLEFGHHEPNASWCWRPTTPRFIDDACATTSPLPRSPAPNRSRVSWRVRTSPCTGLPGRARPCRTARRWPWCSGRGTGSARSSTEFTETPLPRCHQEHLVGDVHVGAGEVVAHDVDPEIPAERHHRVLRDALERPAERVA